MIKHYFSGSQLNTNLTTIINGRGLLDDWADLYAGDTLLTYDPGFGQDVLQKFCDYYSGGDRTAMHSLIWSERRAEVMEMISDGCFTITQLLSDVLANDNTSNELLTALAALDMARFDAVYQMVVGVPAPPTPPTTVATKIATIRGNPDGVVANAIHTQYTLSELETIIEALSSGIQDNVFQGWDFCDLITQIANCGYGSSWYDFVLEEVDEAIVKNIIIQSTEESYLADVLLTNDPWALNKLIDLEPDLISDALRETEDLDVLTYLMYIYQRFGRGVFNQVIDDLGDEIEMQKTLTLDEHHIYGSSRHGIHKPGKLLTRKSFVLEEIESDGVLSFGAAQDSTIAKVDARFFKRTLAYKQYELTNHLGNVLATVLDRKFAYIDSAHGDTLLYYTADASTAQMYYAFGSGIKELSYSFVSGGDTAKYRYGFNNQEKDSELGEYYAFEYRVHDARLGRFLSVDPLSAEYPWNSTYAFAENRVIDGIDVEGKEWLSANARVYVSNGIIKAWVANLHAPLKHYFIREDCHFVGGIFYFDDLGTISFDVKTIDAQMPVNNQQVNSNSNSISNDAQEAVIKQTTNLAPKIDPTSGKASVNTVALKKNGLIDKRFKIRTVYTTSLNVDKISTKVSAIIQIVQIGFELYNSKELENEVNALNSEIAIVNDASNFLLSKVNSKVIPTEFVNDDDLETILNVMLTGLMPDGYVEGATDEVTIASNEKLMKLYNIGWQLINEAKQDPASKANAKIDKVKDLANDLKSNSTDATYVKPAVATP